MELKLELKTEALRLGFNLVGVTSADPPKTFPAYVRWLEQDRHGTMHYLEVERAVERRANPLKILPEVRSLIVVGMRYSNSKALSMAASDNLTGRVASYAWGKDYHDLIQSRLNLLVEFLNNRSHQPVASKVYTDTGPILERDFAVRAGLGWQGKNTCLIEPGSGSYYLLGEILTSLALEPDDPYPSDRCGTCRRCIEVCPTGCILADRTIDARRCISYLTIENKGAIPLELRPQLGNWVFGCDICQQVCPWNIRFASGQFEDALQPDYGIAQPDLIGELQLTPQEFNKRFKDSPIKRARRRGYLRSVAVALGNSKSPRAIPVLESALKNDLEPLVRAHSAWALGQIDTGKARQALIAARAREEDPLVMREINAVLD